ncbi:MAG TPA: thermonuclease family protein [Candidatus Limnocylindrales bacterium]|nr:thermonuclease family protein [Candidatus Limnocylindrales bacterium]
MTRATRLRATLLGLAVLLGAAGCSTQGPAIPPPATAAPASNPPTPGASADEALRPVGETETARVVRVVDGDTLVIDRGMGNERLRYIGIDAPESVKPDTPVAFMGREASAANAALVEGATLLVERDVSDTDQYGRLLRYAWLRDGETWLFVNLELVRQGYAQVVTYPPDVRWIDTLRDAQRVARDAGLGLWGAATPRP